MYAFGTLATLGFLKTVMDDTTLVNTFPENFAQDLVNSNPDQWFTLSK